MLESEPSDLSNIVIVKHDQDRNVTLDAALLGLRPGLFRSSGVEIGD